jgi:hypothetical protein
MPAMSARGHDTFQDDGALDLLDAPLRDAAVSDLARRPG